MCHHHCSLDHLIHEPPQHGPCQSIALHQDVLLDTAQDRGEGHVPEREVQVQHQPVGVKLQPDEDRCHGRGRAGHVQDLHDIFHHLVWHPLVCPDHGLQAGDWKDADIFVHGTPRAGGDHEDVDESAGVAGPVDQGQES